MSVTLPKACFRDLCTYPVRYYYKSQIDNRLEQAYGARKAVLCALGDTDSVYIRTDDICRFVNCGRIKKNDFLIADAHYAADS